MVPVVEAKDVDARRRRSTQVALEADVLDLTPGAGALGIARREHDCPARLRLPASGSRNVVLDDDVAGILQLEDVLDRSTRWQLGGDRSAGSGAPVSMNSVVDTSSTVLAARGPAVHPVLGCAPDRLPPDTHRACRRPSLTVTSAEASRSRPCWTVSQRNDAVAVATRRAASRPSRPTPRALRGVENRIPARTSGARSSSGAP